MLDSSSVAASERAQAPALGPDSPLRGLDAPAQRRGRPEDDHTRYVCYPEWTRVGGEVYVTSTRVKPKGVTPGIADLIVFFPEYEFQLYHEVKLPGDRQSASQLAFQGHCQATHMTYILGDVSSVHEFQAWMGWGVLVREGVLQLRDRRFWPSPFQIRAGRTTDEWKTSAPAARHQERWGWKPTVGALKKLANRTRKQVR